MQAVDAELKGFLNQRNLFWKQSSWAKHLLSDSISVFVCNRRPIPQRYNKWVFRCPNNVPKYQDLQYLATNYADVSDYSSKTKKMKVYNYSDQSQTRKKSYFSVTMCKILLPRILCTFKHFETEILKSVQLKLVSLNLIVGTYFMLLELGQLSAVAYLLQARGSKGSKFKIIVNFHFH